MSGLPALAARKVCRVLEKLGFEPIRQSGEDLGRGLLRSILRDIEVSRDEFLELL